MKNISNIIFIGIVISLYELGDYKSVISTIEKAEEVSVFVKNDNKAQELKRKATTKLYQ